MLDNKTVFLKEIRFGIASFPVFAPVIYESDQKVKMRMTNRIGGYHTCEDGSWQVTQLSPVIRHKTHTVDSQKDNPKTLIQLLISSRTLDGEVKEPEIQWKLSCSKCNAFFEEGEELSHETMKDMVINI